ncbi:hypothetical protein DRQ09_03225 [candidate division KSB1 bacterium]|nr:MAG: hypothetical protein DRQ09_03225 [candidate division KSB1 bacterium]
MKYILYAFLISFFFTISCISKINEPSGYKRKGRWEKLITTGDIPSKRDAHSLVYDSRHHRMILFGGFYPVKVMSDIYSLDLNTLEWKKISEGSLARAYHSAVYDSIMNRMIVFGGEDTVMKPSNQTWEFSFDTKQWLEIPTTGDIPLIRSGNASLFDPGGNRLIIFGGNNKDGVNNETCILNLSTGEWKRQSVTGEIPSARTYMGYSLIDNFNKLIIFGGESSYYEFFRDIYSLDIESGIWSKLETFSQAPPGRSGCAFQFFPYLNSFVIFGGFSTIGSLNDTYLYEIDNKKWVRVYTKGEIPDRRIPFSSIYNPVKKSMIIFGGWNGSIPPDDIFYNDVYELTITN